MGGPFVFFRKFAAMRPRIAIIGRNSLMNIGLKSILDRIIPMAEVCISEDLDAGDNEAFHYFVSAQAFARHSRFFLARRHKTIILAGTDRTMVPEGMHTLNVMQGEEELVRDILRLHQSAHRSGYRAPIEAPVRTSILSERERDVLRLLVEGLINKEIADRLHISINTVITHRRNIVSKLGMRSVSALTVYAVTHGIADIDDI